MSDTVPGNGEKTEGVPLRNKSGKERIIRWCKLELPLLLILIFAGAVIYSNTLNSPFVFDDIPDILENRNIRLTELNLKNVLNILEGHYLKRPLPLLSFSLSYYFHRFAVTGYHLTNIIIHLISGILLFYFIKKTLFLLPKQTPEESSRPLLNYLTAFLSALFWLVHPLNTQSVTYIVQRMTSMASMFYLLSLLFYIQARTLQKQKAERVSGETDKLQDNNKYRHQFFYFAASVISGIFAMLSKQIAATLPFIILLYEWYFFQNMSRKWIKRCLCWLIPPAFIFLALLIFNTPGRNLLHEISSGYETCGFSLSQRVLTESRVILYYISLIFYPNPSRLNLDHDFPISHSLIDPADTIISVIAIAILVAGGFYIARKERLISFCILWYFINSLIESSVIPLAIIFEHRVYLPSMMICLLIVFVTFLFLRHIKIAAVLLTIAAIILSIWTYQRNSVWKDALSLWSDCAKKSPQKPRPRCNMADALAETGKTKEALEEYNKTLEIDPEYALAYNNMGTVFFRLEKVEDAIACYQKALNLKSDIKKEIHYNLGNALVRIGKLDEAVIHFKKVLQLMPQYPLAHNNLGTILIKLGKLEEAEIHLQKALETEPDYAEAYNNLGIIFEQQNKIERAMSSYEKALQLNPDYREAHMNSANLLLKSGKFQEAISHYKEILRTKTDDPVLYFNIGTLLAAQGEFEEAVLNYNRALQIKPDYADAQSNLGFALLKLGKAKEAIPYYQEALKLHPDNPEGYKNLGTAFAIQGNFDNAVVNYRKALEIKPDYAEVHNNLGTILARQKNLKDALTHFQEALRINPEYADAKKNLEIILKEINNK